MAEITMPKLSDTMTEGTLVKWKKKVGDKVESGEVIAEVETDKATMEMESFDEGILTEIYIQEGQKVEVGQRIARVGDKSDAAPPRGLRAQAAAPTPPPPAAASSRHQILPRRLRRHHLLLLLPPRPLPPSRLTARG